MNLEKSSLSPSQCLAVVTDTSSHRLILLVANAEVIQTLGSLVAKSNKFLINDPGQAVGSHDFDFGYHHMGDAAHKELAGFPTPTPATDYGKEGHEHSSSSKDKNQPGVVDSSGKPHQGRSLFSQRTASTIHRRQPGRLGGGQSSRTK